MGYHNTVVIFSEQGHYNKPLIRRWMSVCVCERKHVCLFVCVYTQS